MPSRNGLIIKWGMLLNLRFLGCIIIRTWCSFWNVAPMAVDCWFIMQFSLILDVCGLFASFLGININHGREIWIYTSFSLLVNFHFIHFITPGFSSPYCVFQMSWAIFFMLGIRLFCFCIQPLDYFLHCAGLLLMWMGCVRLSWPAVSRIHKDWGSNPPQFFGSMLFS